MRLLATLNTKKTEAFQSSIIGWFASNGRRFPWRQTRDPFKILIAEVVLKLTGAWKAEQAYKYLTDTFGTPSRMAKANPKELAKAFQPLGLHSRASLLIEIAKRLNKQFDGVVPRTYEELTSLKGVGQYTANAILCLAYSERVPLVDGSVLRVFKRCFNYTTNKEAYADKKLWQIAQELLPKSSYYEYNLGLLDIGALICKHAKLLCDTCPISMICSSASDRLEPAKLERER